MLEVREIMVRFGLITALEAIDLTVEDRSVLALIGPSGSGKSTLLRVVAGLEQPDAGDLLWDGASILNVPPHRRGFGMMFQDYALFPHRTVSQNVSFGLRMQRRPAVEIATRTEAVLDLVGLSGYGPRAVGTLSGGEQQRVALARTLAPEPRLVLLDEPLGALDRALRERLVEDMREIFDEVQATALYVTHDRDEAFAIADRVAVIDEGRIVAVGTPEELWNHPPSDLAAELIGLDHGVVDAEIIVTGDPNATVRRSTFDRGRYRIELDRDEGPAAVAMWQHRLEPGVRVAVRQPAGDSGLRTRDS